MPNDVLKQTDPTFNVRDLVDISIKRLDDLNGIETRRIDEKFKDYDNKYQIQFSSAKEAVAAALVGTKEAINKADENNNKRFDLLSEKIDGITSSMSKSSGERGIYVTHTDLNIAMDKLQAGIEATLRPVVTFMNNQTGQSKGLDQGWNYLIQAVGFVSVIITMYFLLHK